MAAIEYELDEKVAIVTMNDGEKQVQSLVLEQFYRDLG